MFSLISLKPSLGQKFQENAGKIAAVGIAATLIAIFLIYNFIDRGPGTFLPPSPIAGYIILSMTPLFIFDALRYSLLHHKNGLILRPKPHKTVKGNSATIFSSKDSGNSSTAKDASPLVLTPDSLRAAKQEVYERMTAQQPPGRDTIALLSKGLPEMNMILHLHRPTTGPIFYYGTIEVSGQALFVPIAHYDGICLLYQQEHQKPWILKHPHDNTYFIPKITQSSHVPEQHGQSMTFEQMISFCVRSADSSSPSHIDILKVLFPYAKEIHDANGELYQKICRLMPGVYPKNPVPMVWT